MRNIWIGTTWKMNKTLSQAVDYFALIKANLHTPDRFQIFLVLPFTHLSKAKESLEGTKLLLGAQNMHWEDEGEYTGEVSPLMLADIGVNMVEIGHSERRAYYKEDDYSINKKVLAALKHDLLPLICVGEKRVERDYGVTREVVSRQVKIALHGVQKKHCERILIAYEPVWAIGEKGVPAMPEDASEIQTIIRQILQDTFGKEYGNRVSILYGGSVDIRNAASFIGKPNVDGLFIGRAGLDPESFLDIVRNVQAAAV